MQRKFGGICGGCKDWAKVQEYEFWYDYSQPVEDASFIWDAPDETGLA